MSPTVFISISYKHRKIMASTINCISKVIESSGLKPMIFVNQFNLKNDDYKYMMKRAFQGIDKSVCVIAELSHQTIGVGIEIGYARAQGIPIIYLLDKQGKLSTTALGTADYCFNYDTPQQLKELLSPILTSLSIKAVSKK